MNDRRVVITGMGVVTPLGNDLETFWKNLQERRQRDRRIRPSIQRLRLPDRRRGAQFRSEELFSKIPRTSGGPIVSPSLPWPRRKWRCEDGGIDLEKVNRDRFGVIVSSGIGGLKTLEDQHNVLVDKGPSRVSPFTIPMLISNMASGLISMEFGLRGPEHLHRHRLRHFEQRDRRIVAHDQVWRCRHFPRRRLGSVDHPDRSRRVFAR